MTMQLSSVEVGLEREIHDIEVQVGGAIAAMDAAQRAVDEHRAAVAQLQEEVRRRRHALAILRGEPVPGGKAPATEGTVPCPHCDRSFKNQNGLTIHIARSHPDHVAKVTATVPKSADDLPPAQKQPKVQHGEPPTGKPVLMCDDCDAWCEPMYVSDLLFHARHEHGRKLSHTEREPQML